MDKEINIDLPSNIKVDKVTFQKMLFITNAIDKGWSVKKSDDNYIFTKKHENRKEIIKENYLEKFLFSNLSNDDILKN